ncbi:eukaryotic translation initiation factor 4B isoform X2 [Amyelois transitella]|uniref:eukaryotic translation initiation factor 4B isoform X2 n=1 Tax=Amyelois transitella TaxID=680683 RepID=UPI00298F73CF|nr:eukaryotic translation initiation factor 4B isoform X2 [Amyelois transitella]
MFNQFHRGKKSKKSKWIKASITDIIAEPTTIPTINNWADSVDEEPETFGFASRPRAPVVLPSASRAARGGLAVDDESIPRRPPFIAHISNLPYDVDETAITELFDGLKITNLRLPREGDRLKGYGYVDFEDRESLINAMNMPDLTIGGRRIRIDVATQDNDRRMGRGGRSDRDREYDPERTMGDWRSGPRSAPEPARAAAPRVMDRDGMRERGAERERDSSADNRPGGWRDGERAAPEPARTPYGGRDSFGRDRDDRRGFGRDGERERSGYGGRDGFRTAERDGGGFSREGRGFGSRGFGDRDRDPPPREDAKPRERPKLNLLPRTVPREPEAAAPVEERPERPAAKPVPAEKVFGAAKPVDTAAKEREIEERLRKQEEEARRATEEKERWGRRNDHSGDRRGGARRDDRGRDSRSYNRDRRDYSKDDKDRRDYRDDRERRDYSKESRDDKDRRDYRDDRERRSSDDRGSVDRRGSRDRRRSPDRRGSPDRRVSPDRRGSRDRRVSPERRPRSPAAEEERPTERNGRARQSRSREREPEEKPLPKLKEQEKPNFVASNKFSFLEDADDDGGSD